MTNQEPIVLEEARRCCEKRIHRLKRLEKVSGDPLLRKNVLCSTFIGNISLSKRHRWVLRYNMLHTHSLCDWVLVAYEPIEVHLLQKLCEDLSSSLIKKKHPLGLNDTLSGHRKVLCKHSAALNSSLITPRPKSIPKSVLYLDLLPHLQAQNVPYSQVLVMDEDIHLAGFELERFLHYWQCQSHYAPLIVQPLVAGAVKQYIPWLNAGTWKEYLQQRQSKSKSTSMSSHPTIWFLQEVAFIEQQVPLFDAIFFEWFLQSILSRVQSMAMTNGADWGHDRCWCQAAKDYAIHVLKQPERFGCGLIVSSRSQNKESFNVYHLNFQSMKMKREQSGRFREKAADSVMRYIEMFPTWVVVDILKTKNPFTEEGQRVLRTMNFTKNECKM
jgi:hypothetical protein